MLKKLKSFLFTNQTTRQTVAKNAFWLSLSNFVGRLIRAVLIIAAARVLGAAEYGVFSYALSLAAFFTLFSDIGITPILTREAAKDPSAKKEYISTSFFIKLALLALTIALTVFVAPFFTKIEAARPLLYAMAFLLAFDGLQNFAFAITRAENRMELEAWLSVVTNIYIVALSLIALLVFPTSLTLGITYTAGSGLGFLTIYYLLRKEFRGVFTHFRKDLVKKILVAGWPFALSGLLGGIMINTDTIMLGWFRSASEVGLYSAAQRPIQLLILMPGILATSLFPTIARFVQERRTDKIREATEKVVSTVMLVAVPLFFGGIALAAPFMNLLFGKEYVGGASSFAILLGTVLFSFPGIIMNNLLFAYDRQKVFIASTGFGAIGNFALNYVLIPPFGIVGASAATLATQVVVNSYLLWEARKYQDFSILSHLKKIIPAALLMAIVAFGLNALGIPVIANLILSAALYLGILYRFKEPLIKELKLILRSAA